MKIALCIFLAFVCFNYVACYNPYAYSSRFLPRMNPDSYSSMGDIDWSKRSYRYRDPWSFGSMADAEWGWKKRASHQSGETDDEDAEPLALKRGSSRSYKYRQPYMVARPNHDVWATGKRAGYNQPFYQPYQAYARYGALNRPQRNSWGERQNKFASMADADWGWKKRSQAPIMFDDDEFEMEKKNIASLAKFGAFPKKLKMGKRFEADEENEEFEEDKRHIGAFAATKQK